MSLFDIENEKVGSGRFTLPNFNELARESVGLLFSDIVSADRFTSWRAGVVEGAAATLSQYAFGEIFWRQALGRPDTTKLSDAVTIESWRDDSVLAGDINGAATWKTIRAPYYPSWWDGKNDGEYWRVTYMVPNLTVGLSVDGLPEHSTQTHIRPQLNSDVTWTIPGGRLGIGNTGFRTLKTSEVVFIKTDKSVHFSFEVVLRSFFMSP
jgi:hypothetical protein